MRENDRTLLINSKSQSGDILYNSVDSYMRHIDIFSNGLGPEQEKKLSRIIKCSNNLTNKNKAINELVNGNLGLVIKCAQETFKGYHSTLSLMDLITEGNFGLFYSAKNFNYRKDCRFSTYAYSVIRWHMWKAIHTNTIIHIPYNILSYAKKLRCLNREYGGKLTKEILIKELRISGDQAGAIMDALAIRMAYFDADLLNDGNKNDIPLKDRLEDKSSPSPYLETDKRILKEYLEEISNKCLTEKEKKVVDLMFYTDSGATLDELAVKVNVTRERVRQIYARAMRKMRKKFFTEWDSKHHEDIIDNEEIYKAATGNTGYCHANRMRIRYDADFLDGLQKKQDAKGKKILSSLS